jgi:hypothetical protein
MTQPQSTLARFAPLAREIDPIEGRRLAREAFHADNLVLIDPSWITGWGDRQQLIQLAEKVHGRRKCK